MDVAGGDDDVDIRLQRLADLGHQFVAPAPHRIDARHALGGEFLATGLGRRTALGRRLVEGDLAGGYALRDRLGASPGLVHEVDEGPHDAGGQQLPCVLDDDIDEGHIDRVHARDTEKSQGGALGGVGGVLRDVPLDVVGDGARGRASADRQIRVQTECVVHCINPFS